MILKKTVYFILLIIALPWLLEACAYKQQKNIETAFDYTNYRQQFELLIDSMTTLPGNMVFIGGRYHDGANTIHPVLLISRDSGKTWEHNNSFTFSGSGFQSFRTHGSLFVWGLVVFRQEGSEIPQYLVRSSDGGNTWQTIPVNLNQDIGTLCRIKNFNFFNPNNGIIILAGIAGQTILYKTENGGDTWEPVWESQENQVANMVDTNYSYPKPESCIIPVNAPLWTKDLDFYKITGLLRVSISSNFYHIEKYEYQKEKWEKQSSIPIKYEIRDNHIAPSALTKIKTR